MDASLCRLCLQDDPDLLPVHHEMMVDDGSGEPSEELNMVQLVSRYLSIQIIKTENSADTFICPVCKLQIEQWHWFYVSCTQNDEKYPKRLSEQQHDAKYFNPMIEPKVEEEYEVEVFGEEPSEADLGLDPVDVDNSSTDSSSSTDVDYFSSDSVENPVYDPSDEKQSKPKKRGRPRGSTSKEKVKPPADPELPAKKRGRPRINPKRKQYKYKKMCTICGKIFSSLSAHMLSHNNERRYQCEYCLKTFVGRSNYFSHVNIHTREKVFKCKLCGHEYQSRRGLKQHMDAHSGERKHECTVCHKTFTQQTSLARHKLNHFEVPKVKCPECGRLFYTKAELTRHLKTHSTERPFSCEICARAFCRKDNLKTHMKVHQPKTPSSKVSDKSHQSNQSIAVDEFKLASFDT